MVFWNRVRLRGGDDYCRVVRDRYDSARDHPDERSASWTRLHDRGNRDRPPGEYHARGIGVRGSA